VAGASGNTPRGGAAVVREEFGDIDKEHGARAARVRTPHGARTLVGRSGAPVCCGWLHEHDWGLRAREVEATLLLAS